MGSIALLFASLTSVACSVEKLLVSQRSDIILALPTGSERISNVGITLTSLPFSCLHPLPEDVACLALHAT